MQGNEPTDQDEFITEVAREFLESTRELPILARLMVARDLVFNRFGSIDDEPAAGVVAREPTMMAAVDILNDVIDIVEARPHMAKLGTPGYRLPMGGRATPEK